MFLLGALKDVCRIGERGIEEKEAVSIDSVKLLQFLIDVFGVFFGDVLFQCLFHFLISLEFENDGERERLLHDMDGCGVGSGLEVLLL